MPNIQSIIELGTANPWLYLPFAVLLGALHALEPGHSKSLMAAFIIAIRGTAMQGVILGLSAAVGHTIVVWGLALIGIWLGDKLILDKAAPWLLIISGLLVIALAVRLAGFTFARKPAKKESHNGHNHGKHTHEDEHNHEDFHGDEDAHAAMHEREIAANFAGRRDVTTSEIMWFGFTGGLLPCPAAIAVLIVCLQLQRYGLGIAMVGAFSAGLAITMVTIGVVAAWGARHAAKHMTGFGGFTKYLPLISAVMVALLGVLLTLRGVYELQA